MFETLSERLSKTLRHISGKAKLTEANISETLSEVRKALLDADVALDVVQQFIIAVKHQALGQKVSAELSPGQFFLKIVKEGIRTNIG